MAEARVRVSDNEMDDWLAVIDRLPFIASVKRDALGLRRMIYERRPPRIVALGAEGVGKTTLVNALLGAKALGEGGVTEVEAGRWVHIDAGGRRLDWMEIEGTTASGAGRIIEEAFGALESHLPDMVLVLCDSESGSDTRRVTLDTLRGLREMLSDCGASETVYVGVLVGRQEVAPGSGVSPGLALETAEKRLRDELGESGISAEMVLSVRGLASEPGGPPPAGLDFLADKIVDHLPEPAQLEACRALAPSRDARRRIGRALVNRCASLGVTVGLAPIPFADAFVLLPLQAAMVAAIAYIGGRPWDRRAALEWLASLGVAGGAGLGLRWGAQQLAKLVPGAGTLVGASVAGAGTLAIGRSAIVYFIDRLGTPRAELRPDNEP